MLTSSPVSEYIGPEVGTRAHCTDSLLGVSGEEPHACPSCYCPGGWCVSCGALARHFPTFLQFC